MINIKKWTIRGLAIITACIALFASQAWGVVCLGIFAVVISFAIPWSTSITPTVPPPSYTVTIPTDAVGYALKNAFKLMITRTGYSGDVDDLWEDVKSEIRPITFDL